MLRYKIKLDLV